MADICTYIADIYICVFRVTWYWVVAATLVAPPLVPITAVLPFPMSFCLLQSMYRWWVALLWSLLIIYTFVRSLALGGGWWPSLPLPQSLLMLIIPFWFLFANVYHCYSFLLFCVPIWFLPDFSYVCRDDEWFWVVAVDLGCPSPNACCCCNSLFDALLPSPTYVWMMTSLGWWLVTLVAPPPALNHEWLWLPCLHSSHALLRLFFGFVIVVPSLIYV